ncbi:hypothetical protein [Sphingomonas sp. CFBP 13706]|uniref:hypothetical protein n=1 Tax=Sphingomonas sp. CFBP 13706 TaxID=2775314 RepID=UPI0017867BF8|nr:hypothetical protein [Sphingomonas sp. CFBP 13706]MBD8734894.1 hypothetical protein [Sphingomonas sp. CFBP 13706]
MTDKTNETETPNDDVSGLKANNADLKSRLDKATKANKTLEDRLDQLEAAQNDAADTTKSEVEKAQAKLQREIDKLTTLNQKLNSTLATKTIDGAISAAIAKAGVLPEHVAMLTKALKADASMNDTGEAVTLDGTSFEDHLGSYFASKEAKSYIAAPMNSGAGAAGSSAKGSMFAGEPKTAEDFKKFEELAKTNPAEAQAYAKTWNWPTLDI